MSKTQPFDYFGSKSRQLEFINSKLPRTRQYIEPFGGAATILLNRDPVPTETYNDLHGDIPHFFEVLRDRPDELLDALRKTPYSRDEYGKAIAARNNGYRDCSALERARLFFVLMQQSRSMRQHGFDTTNWSYTVWGAGRETSGHDGTTTSYSSRVCDDLDVIAGRLTDVQIENRPAIDVIETHDRETATFYCDPPYPPEVRGSNDNYSVEMDAEDHRELFGLLDSCEGYVAISGYECDLYDGLYSEWYRYEDEERPIGGGKRRTEVLWTNYDADELGRVKIGAWGEPTRKGQQLTLVGSIE